MLIVDAYNVLHLPEAAARDLDVVALCRLIGASRYAGARLLVVCDGTQGRGPQAGMADERARLNGADVVYVGPGRTADDEIEARIRRQGGSGVTVVSDDRRLRRAASRARARSLGSGAFLAHILADERRFPARQTPAFAKDLPLDRYAIAHWLQEFGLPAADLLARRSGEGRRTPAPPAGGNAASTQRRAGRAEAPPAPSGNRDSGLLGASGPPGPVPPSPDRTDLEALAEDPVIREALEAWRGRLSLEDLDMQRWLDGPSGRGSPD